MYFNINRYMQRKKLYFIHSEHWTFILELKIVISPIYSRCWEYSGIFSIGIPGNSHTTSGEMISIIHFSQNCWHLRDVHSYRAPSTHTDDHLLRTHTTHVEIIINIAYTELLTNGDVWTRYLKYISDVIQPVWLPILIQFPRVATRKWSYPMKLSVKNAMTWVVQFW